MWTMKTEFITDVPLEHGNWSSISFDTEAEARTWWDAKDTLSTYSRVMTLTDPAGKVLATRTVPVGAKNV
jgi:hypothetical protein